MTVSWNADVGIVGAGPAGAWAAELLASAGVRVVLLDPKAPWEKPCGGGLTPPLFDEIPEFAEVQAFSRPVTRVRVETAPDNGFTVPLERPMWVVARRELGAWQLSRAVAAGATHLPLKVRTIRRTAAGWVLETPEGEVVTPFLVGADGAASLVRRVAAPGFDVERAPTRVAYPMGAGPTPDTAILQFYPGIAGYLWDFPRLNERSVGIGVPNGTWRRSRLDGEIDAYRASQEDCSCTQPERAGAVIGTAQLGHGDYSRIGGGDFALLGDAAGLADPLTGEGIQNALRSAELFTTAWLASDPLRYPVLARRAFEREFQVARFLRRTVFETERSVRLIRRATRSRFWYAVVAAIVNAVNEHDGRVTAGLARLVRNSRQTRTSSGPPGEVRPLHPCHCAASGEAHACGEEGVAGGERGVSAVA